ncbi:MAG: hypothetical protein M5U31_09205 [Acidimicrobiia bacterium]|nr:hypothetical protein [Acidimicrobiia bacterium]
MVPRFDGNSRALESVGVCQTFVAQNVAFGRDDTCRREPAKICGPQRCRQESAGYTVSSGSAGPPAGSAELLATSATSPRYDVQKNRMSLTLRG